MSPEDWTMVAIAAAGALAALFLVVAAYLTGLHDGLAQEKRLRAEVHDAHAQIRRLHGQLGRRPLHERARPKRPTYAGHQRVLPPPPRPLRLHDLQPWRDPTVKVPAVRTLELAAAHG